MAQAELEEWESALVYLQEGLKTREHDLPEGDLITIKTCCTIAYIYQIKGMASEAVEKYRHALRVAQLRNAQHLISRLTVTLVSSVLEDVRNGANDSKLHLDQIKSIAKQVCDHGNPPTEMLFTVVQELLDSDRTEAAEEIIRIWLNQHGAADTDGVNTVIARTLLRLSLEKQRKLADADRLSSARAELQQRRISVPEFLPATLPSKTSGISSRPDEAAEKKEAVDRDRWQRVRFVARESAPSDRMDYAGTLIGLATSPDRSHIYGLSSDQRRIVVFNRRHDTGELKPVQTIEEENAFRGLANMRISSSGRFGACHNRNSVLLFKRNIENGTLELLCQYQNMKGRSLWQPRSIAFSSDSGSLFVAVEDGQHSSIVTLRFSPGGTLHWQTKHKNEYLGLGEFQDLVAHPNGRWLYATSSKNGAIVVCNIDETSRAVSTRQVLHFANDSLQVLNRICLCPDGKFIYVSGHSAEGQGAIGVLSIGESGRLNRVQEVVPDGDSGAFRCEADGLAVSPDGRACFACARTSGTVARFARDPDRGLLTFIESVYLGPTDGGPTNLCFSPDGSYLYVGTADTNSITVLQIGR